MVVEMCEGLIAGLSLRKVGSVCDLVTMKNAHLPDTSSKPLILSYHGLTLLCPLYIWRSQTLFVPSPGHVTHHATSHGAGVPGG